MYMSYLSTKYIECIERTLKIKMGWYKSPCESYINIIVKLIFGVKQNKKNQIKIHAISESFIVYIFCNSCILKYIDLIIKEYDK